MACVCAVVLFGGERGDVAQHSPCSPAPAQRPSRQGGYLVTRRRIDFLFYLEIHIVVWWLVFLCYLDVFLPSTSQVVNCIQLSSLVERQDRRVSGSSLIDEQLQGVVSMVVRDFVLSWYNNLSTHQAFITHLHRTIQHSMVILANRLVFLCLKPIFCLFLKVIGKNIL